MLSLLRSASSDCRFSFLFVFSLFCSSRSIPTLTSQICPSAAPSNYFKKYSDVFSDFIFKFLQTCFIPPTVFTSDCSFYIFVLINSFQSVNLIKECFDNRHDERQLSSSLFCLNGDI